MKKTVSAVILLVVAQIEPCSAVDMRLRRVEFQDSSGFATAIRVSGGRKLFLSTRGENPNCHDSGIEAVLDVTTRYVIRCKNDPKTDRGMKTVSHATYDGKHLKISSRSELDDIYFNYSYDIEIAGDSCSGGLYIQSNFGNFVKTISSCKISY